MKKVNLNESEMMAVANLVPTSKHLFNEELTLLGANPSFYSLFGYGEQSDALTEIFEKNSLNFGEISKKLEICHDEKQIRFDHAFIDQTGNRFWVRVTAVLLKEKDETENVYLTYINIDDIWQSKNKLEEIKDERTNNFEWMMAEYAGNVYISDMDTYDLLYVNKHSCDTLQVSQSQLIGRKCYEAIQGRSSPCPFCTNSRLSKEKSYDWEFYNPNLNRTFMIKNRMLDWYGHKARIELSYDMYSAEFKLAKKDQEREAILKTVPAGMIRVDARDCKTVLWHNGIFLDMIGYTNEQFEKELHNECTYMHPDDLKRALSLVMGMKKTGENVLFEARAYTRTKEERLWTVTLCYISGEDSWDGIPSYYSIGLDITSERRQIEKLQHKAEKDALTGIYNRDATETQIRGFLSEKPKTMSALFMIDTDNFKHINDTHGHVTGDIVLSEMASGMKKMIRDTDLVGRIGGDEFTIFMKNISSVEVAEKKAEELLEMFNHLFEHDKKVVKVSCSIGISVYPKDGNTFEEMYQCADKALYKAKTSGKNSYVLYDQSIMKGSELSIVSSLGAMIDSEQHYAESSDNLARYVFRILYQMSNIDEAIQMVMEIVGRQFDIDRIYIYETIKEDQHIKKTYEWSSDGTSSPTENFQYLDCDQLKKYADLFNQENIFYCRDICKLPVEQSEFFTKQGVKATLQCAFKDGEKITGLVRFDECIGRRFWTKEEVSTLSLISNILDVILRANRNK